MRSQSATITITRAVTVAAGVFAPASLAAPAPSGALSCHLPGGRADASRHRGCDARSRPGAGLAWPAGRSRRGPAAGLTKLEFPGLDRTGVRDAAVLHLAALPGLKRVRLAETRVSPAGGRPSGSAFRNWWWRGKTTNLL